MHVFLACREGAKDHICTCREGAKDARLYMQRGCLGCTFVHAERVLRMHVCTCREGAKDARLYMQRGC